MDAHQGKIVDRIVAGRSIVVLCAPPGFGKSHLAREAASRISTNSALSLCEFGEIEHRADPRAAADALLAQTKQVTIIEDAHLTDRNFMSLALERISFRNSGQRIIMTMS